MTLAADAARLTVEIGYRNVSDAPIRAGVTVRTELTGRLGRNAPRVILPVEPRRLGLFPRCKGLRRARPAAGWILNAPAAGERLLFRYDLPQVQFVRGFTANAYAERMYAVSLEQNQRKLAPAESVSLTLLLDVLGADVDPDSLEIADLAAVLRNLPALRKHPGGLSAYAPWGVVSLPQVLYKRTRPWARAATEYRAGDDVRLRSTFTAFTGPNAPAPKPVRVLAKLETRKPNGTLEAHAAIPPSGSTDLVFAAAKIGPVAGPYRCETTVEAGGERRKPRVLRIRYHHRGDTRIPRGIQLVRSHIAALRKRRTEANVRRVLPWIEKRLEYAENLHEIGDYRYRPFCHGQAREEAYGSSSEALALLDDALKTTRQLRDPSERQPIPPGGHVFCYDLARYGAKFTPFPGDLFAEKLAKFKTQVEKLEANPDAAKDVGWYKALYLLARRALDDGIRADDGDAPAAVLRMHEWIDDCLKRIAKWPDDGYRQGKFRFPYGGRIDFYTKHVERYRGYSVYLPACYDGQTALPVLVDPNSYGGLMPAWTAPADPDPVTLDGATELYGYIRIFPGHTNTYSRSGNPEDVRRVLDDAATFLKIDRDRIYCAGGSLNADATGNLGNSMLETWAAVAPFSQGAQLWTKKTARLPRVTFQAGGEAAVFIKGVRKYQEWGVYDPAIHRGGHYPGVSHCRMSHDMWQFVFEFFARHKRRPATTQPAATRAADGDS